MEQVEETLVSEELEIFIKKKINEIPAERTRPPSDQNSFTVKNTHSLTIQPKVKKIYGTIN